jgi:beta-lactamase class A
MTLTDDLRRIVEPLPGRFGVYARNLTTGDTVDIDANRTQPTASAAKQFVLLTYAQQIAHGDLDADARLTLTADDNTLGSGVLRYLTPGLTPTHDDLACLMIILSDNVATNVMIRTVGGPDAVNDCMASFGLPHAHLNSYSGTVAFQGTPFATATARDLAESFALVAPSRPQLDPVAAERCRNILFRQQHRDGLPRRLPALADAHDFGYEMPLRVYNKTGSEPGVCTEAALFVTKDAEWVAAVMGDDLPLSKSTTEDIGPTACAAVGAALYAAWGEQRA